MLRLDRAYSAVLFDMDGTLLDSSAVIERVLTDWAVSKGLDPLSVLAVSHGRTTADVVRDVANAGTDFEAEAARIEAAETADVRGIIAVPGAVALLDGLPRKRWAIVTSAGRDLAARRLAAAGLPVPEVLITAEDIDNGKPDPSGYILAAKKLGTRADQCLVFEDAPAGIQAGLNAGSDVIAIGFANPDATALACPLIADFRDITFKLN